MIQGNDGGAYVTETGAKSWRYLNNLPIEQFYMVAADNNSPYMLCGGLQDNKDRKSTRLNSSHQIISYAVFCLKKKTRKLRPSGCITSHARSAPAGENRDACEHTLAT